MRNRPCVARLSGFFCAWVPGCGNKDNSGNCRSLAAERRSLGSRVLVCSDGTLSPQRWTWYAGFEVRVLALPNSLCLHKISWDLHMKTEP